MRRRQQFEDERDPACRDSGVAVEEHVFAGMPHGFSMVPFLTDGLRSLDLAGAFLRTRAGA